MQITVPDDATIPDCDPAINPEDCEPINKQNAATTEAMKWLSFFAGVILGGLIEFIANWDNWPCLSDIVSLLESAYLIYFYLSSYVQTGDANDVAAAVLYLVIGFETGFAIRCGSNLLALPHECNYDPSLPHCVEYVQEPQMDAFTQFL